jgi:ATP-dependent Zn protease
LARAMVEQYGMGVGLGAFSFITGRSSEKTRENVDEAVYDIVEYALVQAKKRLTELQGVRNRLLFKLLKDGLLEGSAVMAAM